MMSGRTTSAGEDTATGAGADRDADPRAAKRALRTDLLRRRQQLDRGEHAMADTALRQAILAQARHLGATTVCAYLPMTAEPGSPVLLDALRVQGMQVLLPLLQADGDLDWAPYAGRERLVTGQHGLFEPAGQPLGVQMPAEVDLLVVPALAVDRRGYRLGRGGGSYDRVLSRVRPGTPVVGLVFDHEVLPTVPVEEHDRWVTHIATPRGGVRRSA